MFKTSLAHRHTHTQNTYKYKKYIRILFVPSHSSRENQQNEYLETNFWFCGESLNRISCCAPKWWSLWHNKQLTWIAFVSAYLRATKWKRNENKKRENGKQTNKNKRRNDGRKLHFCCCLVSLLPVCTDAVSSQWHNLQCWWWICMIVNGP